MRRILFVTGTRYLPGNITGANVSVHSLCNRLVSEGSQPIVVCLPDAAGGAGPHRHAPVPDYTVLRVSDPVAAMLEIIERLAPDSVVLHGTQAAARAMELSATLRHALHIYFSTTFYGYPAPPAGMAPRLRYAVNSRYLATFARAYLGFPVALVPPLFEPSEYRCQPNADAVLFVNPIAAKGVHLVAAIAGRLPHRRFLIVRSWPDERHFPHVAFTLPNVEFVDSSPDVRTIYARAKLVLMPTIMEEGWGRTVSEAQISGIPAIASDRGGLPETVGPGGVIVPLGDPVERWCEVIEELFSDPARYASLSQSAKRHAERPELAPANVMARFLEFLAS